MSPLLVLPYSQFNCNHDPVFFSPPVHLLIASSRTGVCSRYAGEKLNCKHGNLMVLRELRKIDKSFSIGISLLTVSVFNGGSSHSSNVIN